MAQVILRSFSLASYFPPVTKVNDSRAKPRIRRMNANEHKPEGIQAFSREPINVSSEMTWELSQ